MRTIYLGQRGRVGGQALYYDIIIGNVDGKPHVTAHASFFHGGSWANYSQDETAELLRNW